MNFNKLTTKAQEALQGMQTIAQARGHQALETEHLLLALLDQPDGVVAAALQKMNIPLGSLRNQIEAALDKKARVSGSGGDVYMTRELREVLDRAETEAK